MAQWVGLLSLAEGVCVVLEGDFGHEPAVAFDCVLDCHESAVRKEHPVSADDLALRVSCLVRAEVESFFLVFHVVFVLVLYIKKNLLMNTETSLIYVEFNKFAHTQKSVFFCISAFISDYLFELLCDGRSYKVN